MKNHKARGRKRSRIWPFYSAELIFKGGHYGMTYGKTGATLYYHAFSIAYITGPPEARTTHFRVNNARAYWIFPNHAGHSLTQIKIMLESSGGMNLAEALMKQGCFNLDMATRTAIRTVLKPNIIQKNRSYCEKKRAAIEQKLISEQKIAQEVCTDEVGIDRLTTLEAIFGTELIRGIEDILTTHYKPEAMITAFLARK